MTATSATANTSPLQAPPWENGAFDNTFITSALRKPLSHFGVTQETLDEVFQATLSRLGTQTQFMPRQKESGRPGVFRQGLRYPFSVSSYGGKFIVLHTKASKHLAGAGSAKKVHECILYDGKQAFPVAGLTIRRQFDLAQREWALIQQLTSRCPHLGRPCSEPLSYSTIDATTMKWKKRVFYVQDLYGPNLEKAIQCQLSIAARLRVLSCAALGLADLHEHGYVHRDVKLENFVLCVEKSPTGNLLIGGKLVDLAYCGKTAEQLLRFTGNKGQLAPEIVQALKERETARFRQQVERNADSVDAHFEQLIHSEPWKEASQKSGLDPLRNLVVQTLEQATRIFRHDNPVFLNHAISRTIQDLRGHSWDHLLNKAKQDGIYIDMITYKLKCSWSSPEMLSSLQTPKAESWAFGVTLYLALHTKEGLDHEFPKFLLQMLIPIAKKRYTDAILPNQSVVDAFLNQVPAGNMVQRSVRYLLSRCWQIEPNARPDLRSIGEALEQLAGYTESQRQNLRSQPA